MVPSVLIVDDEKHTREGLQQALQEHYDVSVAASADEAFNLMEAQEFEVIVTDLRMPGKSGLKVIDKALTLVNKPAVLMMTAYGNIESAVEAMKRGAVDFLTKPVQIERLEILIQRALKTKTLEVEVKQLHERLDHKFNIEGIVGHSAKLGEVIARVKLVAPSKATILIEGETGTGKELIAQAIHQASPRARAPFVPVHCAALPAALLESELFGHERGSFTGATERREGRFETKSFERIGSTKTITVDVRLVAATNRNLEQMVKEGKFREDLFFRLNVVRITMPPLRERTDDIPVLLEHFIKMYAAENAYEPVLIESGAMQHLQRYPWPGNIRELRNFSENAVVLRRGGKITEFDLEPKFRGEVAPPPSLQTPSPANPYSVEAHAKILLREALMKARGNRTKAAQLLGISRRTLHRKLAQSPELDVLDRG